MKALKTIEIKLTSKNLTNTIPLVQEDSGRSIDFIITDMEIPTGATARLYAVKPDGTELFNSCIIKNNIVTVNLTNQTLAVSGIIKCQIRITSGDDIVTTFRFKLEVEENLISESAILSSNEFGALEEAMKTVNNMNSSIKDLEENLSKKANQIDVDILDSTLSESLENMFPGGTNILTNTNSNVAVGVLGATFLAGGWSGNTTASVGERIRIAITDAPNPHINYGFEITKTSGTGALTIYQQFPATVLLNANYQYTLSCYARIANGSPALLMQYGTASSGSTLTSEWKRYSLTFVPTATTSTNLHFGITGATNGTIQIHGMKLELGNKATDWSLSPWDAGGLRVNSAAARTGYTYLENGLKMCWGTVDVTPTVANTPTAVPVTFPIKFTYIPVVVTNARSSGPGTAILGCCAGNESITGFSVYLTRINTNSTAVTWFAVGM